MAEEALWTTLQDPLLLDNIRKRPSMYIGAIGPAGLESLMLQVLDGFLLLAAEPKQSSLTIQLSEQQITIALTSPKGLRTGQATQANGLSVHFFLALINALSRQVGLGLEIAGKRKIAIYHAGKLKKEAQFPADGKTAKIEVAFTPEPNFFANEPLAYFTVLHRCQQLAMLNSGLRISLTDGVQNNQLLYPHGLLDYVYQKDETLTRTGKPIIFTTTAQNVVIQAVISKNHSTSVKDSFVNGYQPMDGGTHLDGFVQGTVEALNEFLEATNRLKYFTTDNLSERFDLALAIQVPRPRYVGAVKKKIRNPELYKILRAVAHDEVARFLQQNPRWYAS